MLDCWIVSCNLRWGKSVSGVAFVQQCGFTSVHAVFTSFLYYFYPICLIFSCFFQWQMVNFAVKECYSVYIFQFWMRNNFRKETFISSGNYVISVTHPNTFRFTSPQQRKRKIFLRLNLWLFDCHVSPSLGSQIIWKAPTVQWAKIFLFNEHPKNISDNAKKKRKEKKIGSDKKER